MKKISSWQIAGETILWLFLALFNAWFGITQYELHGAAFILYFEIAIAVFFTGVAIWRIVVYRRQRIILRVLETVKQFPWGDWKHVYFDVKMSDQDIEAFKSQFRIDTQWGIQMEHTDSNDPDRQNFLVRTIKVVSHGG